MFNSKTVIVTGGTGTFGNAFIKLALKENSFKKIIIFSRDEYKQFKMQQKYKDPRLNYFLGDVRDKERLLRAFDGVDYVVHAAALKHVPSSEYNPFEAILTNVIGAENVINAAIDKGVKRIIALSTDKAANPVNLYGATKFCSDKLFVAGNAYSGLKDTKFAVVRYGNVVGSRGSVIPFFLKKRKTGVLPITDIRMTRFWIQVEEGVRFVLNCFNIMEGGEIFVPKIPSMKVIDLAKAIGGGCRHEIVGIRPGEKLHEIMITEDDSRNTTDCGDYYVISPSFEWQHKQKKDNNLKGQPVPDGFRYTSDNNEWWLKEEELLEIIGKIQMNMGSDYSSDLVVK